MNTSGCLAHRLRTLVTLCGLGLGPSVLSAQKALVYCPVGIDPTGCTTLVQSLGDSGGPFAQRVDMGYDGTDGTIDLASADLSPYAVFIVPALADNADTKPYDRLRTATVASRLRNVLLGRIAVWSGTPDQGTVSRTEKNTLVRNLAVWGAANYATSGLRGLVVLQDYSDSLAERYAWVAEISRLAVAADSAPGNYNEVQALTATATQLLNNGGQQLAYTDMASFGIEPPGDSSSATADARGGTSGSQVVLVSSLGHGNGAATVKTDQADYAPGQVVTITGSGWQFGEVVSLVLHEDPAIDTHPTLTATADASGHILNNQCAPDVHDVGVRFYMTATGQTSGSVALATFTDDNFSVGAVSPASGPTLGGTPVTITGTSFTNGRQPFTVSFGTGAPVSATRADNQTLTATTPTHTAGTVDVMVTGNAGQGNATSVTLKNGFTFTRLDQAAVTISAPGNATFGTAGGTATASGGSGTGAYSFSAGASTACSIDANTGVITVTSGTGTCSLTATRAGDANYNATAASVPATVTIHREPSTTVVSCPAAAQTYTGAPIEPCTAAATGPGGLNVAVTPVSYSSNTNVGTASASATYGGDANHLGSTGAASFSIGQATSTTTVSCPAGPYTYDGTAHTPCSATVTGVGGLSLTPTPSYSGNTNAGTATASYTFPGDANHTGSSDSKTFDITKAASVTAITVTNATYDGSPHGGTAMVTGVGGLNQSVTVNYAGVSPTSYGPSTTAPTDAGTYRLRGTFAGDDNHLGSQDAQTMTIAPASSTTAVSCPAGPYTYTGAAQMPCSAMVTGASLSLTPTPSYANNTDAGTATASYTFAGDANHTRSSDSKAFTIGQASSTTVVTCPSAAQTYTGSPQTPCSATATGAGGLNVAVAPVTYTNNTNVGTAGASATYAGDANHLGSTGTGGFTIDRAASAVSVTCTAGAPYTYTGSAQTPCTAAATGVGMSPVHERGSLSYANNIAAGAATAAASWAGDLNHTGSTGTGGFAIGQAASAVTVTCPAAAQTYTGLPIEPCTAGATGAGGLNVGVTPVTYTSNTNVGTAGASTTYGGDANHFGSTGTGSFAIGKAASSTVVTFEAGPYTYRGTAFTATAQVSGVGGLSAAVTPVVYTGDCTNVTSANGCTATATYGGDQNHQGNSGSKSITLTQAILAVTADNKTMLLSGPLPALTGTLTGVKNGDGITASYSTSANGTSVGVFPIVPSLYDPNAKLGNYTVATTNGNLTVQYAQGGICLASPGHQIMQPVNADGSSVFKKGSTIPVKFRVCDANANPIGGAGQVVTVWNQNWPVLYWKSSGAGAIDEEVLSTTPDTQFRWDDTAQQWVFNLNSKNLTAGMIYTYRIYLNDTSNIEFKFGVK